MHVIYYEMGYLDIHLKCFLKIQTISKDKFLDRNINYVYIEIKISIIYNIFFYQQPR